MNNLLIAIMCLCGLIFLNQLEIMQNNRKNTTVTETVNQKPIVKQAPKNTSKVSSMSDDTEILIVWLVMTLAAFPFSWMVDPRDGTGLAIFLSIIMGAFCGIIALVN